MYICQVLRGSLHLYNTNPVEKSDTVSVIIIKHAVILAGLLFFIGGMLNREIMSIILAVLKFVNPRRYGG